MALELVLLVPVMVLLTVFVLWAGRGGQAALTADLAAEEAATAAALCCEDGEEGEPGREALVQDVIEARPGLEFLCVGGLRPAAEPDSGGGDAEFVSEHWLDFDPLPGVRSGGVGVLGVQFMCESDGAVAPLRGLFPTVTFHGQASEVVVREPPPPDVGFESMTFSVNEDQTTLVFAVTAGSPMPQDVEVEYLVVNAHPDLVTVPSPLAATGTVTINAGDQRAEIVVGLNEDDILFEGPEQLELELTGLFDPGPPRTPLPVTVAKLDPDRQTATGVVTDDDPPPFLFVSSRAVPCEVQEGGALVFDVRLRKEDNSGPAPSASTVTVDVTTEDGTATAAANDYTALSLTALGGNPVTFNPGDHTMTVTVQILDDTSMPEGEDTETFKLVLSNGGVLLGAAEVTCTILDDEARVTVADVAVDEGDQLTFQISLDRDPTANIDVEYRLIDHNLATHPAVRGAAPCDSDDDYLELTVTLTGTLTITFPHDHLRPVDLPAVTTCEDPLVEFDETFWLEVSIPSGGGEAIVELGEGAIGTIRNDDIPVVAVEPAVGDGIEGQPDSVDFTVSLDGMDLDGNTQTVQLTEDITVDYTVGGAGTDPATDPGQADADYAVTLDTASPPGLSGSTLAGTLTFNVATIGTPAVTEHIFAVELLPDYLVEGTETLRLDLHNLTDPIGAAVFEDRDSDPVTDDSHADATIRDDPLPVLSASDFRGPEGTDQHFTVTLANPRAGETVTVNYVIGGGTATAPAPGETLHDYTANSGSLSGTLNFPDGTIQHLVGVSLRRDAIHESEETVRLVLSSPDRAVLSDRDPVAVGVQAYGEGTIVNEDAPELFVDDTVAREGETLTFTVTLCNPIPNEAVTVDYETLARSAAAGRDFTADADTLTFPAAMAAQPVTEGCGAGVTADAKSLTVGVATLNDRIEESDEEVHLHLDARTPDHVGFGKKIGVGRIVNVSAATVRVNNPTAVEGNELNFLIELVNEDGAGGTVPAVITQSVTVDFGVEDRTAAVGADCAVAGADYAQRAGGSHTFTPTGLKTHAVTVQTCTDTVDEDDETLALVLRLAADSSHAGLGDAEGTGTIRDRPPPGIRIDDPAAVREGVMVTFTVSLNDENGLASTSEIVTVKYLTRDSSATAGEDYEPELSGEITFQPGEMQQTLTINTLIDDVWEPAEEFRVDLHTPDNAILDKAVGTGTIRADCIEQGGSEIPTLTVYEQQVDEGSHGNIWASLDRPLCFSFTVEWMFAADTATPADFHSAHSGDFLTPTTYTLNPSNSADERFSVYPFILADDDLDEEDEEFRALVRWESGMPARFLNNNPWVEARFTILDNDPLPNVSIADAAAMAGDSMTFEVSLDAVSGREVTVDFYTVDVTAEGNGVDYSSVPAGVPTTVGIPAGRRSVTFTVQTVANTPGEIDETFHVVLAGASNARIDDGVGVGTILAQAGPSLSIADASAGEGETMSFSVTLSEAATHPVTVGYVANVHSAGLNPATPGEDYVAVSGTLTFSPGDFQKFILVDIEPDDIDEANETFLVELSNQTAGVSLADAVAVGTIRGNVECIDLTPPSAVDLPDVVGQISGPSVSGYTDIAVREDSGEITLTLTFETPFCHGYPVLYERVGGSARRNVDYVMPYYGRVQMAPLDPDVDIVIPIVNDSFTEGDEDVYLRLRGNISARFRKFMEPLTVRFEIVDDDESRLELPDAGDTFTSEGGFLSFVVRLDKPTTERVEFDYETRDGPAPVATEDVDYEPRRGTAAIPPGALSVTIPVRTIEDALDENDENIELVISDLTGAEPDPDSNSAVGRITDDDAPPSARVSDASADEGGTLEFAVTLSAPSGRQVSVPVATDDGTARTADGDYVALASTHVVFAPGVTRQIVRVQTLTDSEVESSEVVWLDLGPMDNNTATIGDSRGRGLIRDVSDRRVSVSDAAVIEGGTLVFEVGFSEGPSSRDVTVRYRTRAGTAAAGDDYDDQFEFATRELRIVAGDASATVLVPTEPDRLDEDNETLELELSSPDGAVIVNGTASGVIIDNDPEPALRVSDAEATEADGASATFTLSLSEASGRDVTVAYRTVDDTATAGADYTAPTGTTPGTDPTATITAGDTTATVDVALVNDDVAEDVETFRLEVTGAVNAQRDDSVGVATIIDDDGPIQIIVDDPAYVYEGDGASAVFTVRLSRDDAANAVTVMYSTVDGTATAGADYAAATSQTLTFLAGSITETVTVPLVNDDIIEDAETFRLVLSSPSSNAEIGDGEATVLVLDDDGLPTLSVADAATAVEGSTATFTITLSRAVAQDATVAYAAVADPTAADEAAAAVGLDYTATSGTATVAARGTSTTVTVPLLQDSFDENSETFWLRLSIPTGATIVDGTATGTINDDDPLPAINISDAGATEGSTLSFEVRLDAFSGRTVTVPWTTEARPAGASAASPAQDYTAASGTARFAPGATTARVEVASLQDETSENDETFLLQLGTPVNAALDDSTAVGAILDDDGEPRISITDTTVHEDDGPAIFAVTLSNPSSQPVTVAYTTADGTGAQGATNPGDYAPDQVRTLTIPAAFIQGEISVFIVDDADAEGTETFTITLTNPVNAVIAEGAGTATGTIVDDEGTPRLSVSDAQECEDGSSLADCAVRLCRTPRGIWTYEEYMACQSIRADPGACQEGMCGGDGTLEFAVQLSHASTEETSVRYSTFANSAASPRDYIATTGTLTILAGDTTASIPLTLVNDGVHERQTETFRLVLDNPAGVELETEHATGTIRDDDLPPRVSAGPFDSLLANENDGFAYHRVTLSHSSDLTATVDYNFDYVDDRSPFAGVDDTPGTITFAPGVVEQTIEVPLFDNNVATHTPGRGFNYATTFYRIELGDFVNASSRFTTGAGVVWDDETPPYVDSVASQDVLEGAGSATFTITLNRFSDTAVTATYRTADGTATAGSDYTAAEATVTFPAGALTADVSVPILDDTVIESDETFTLSIIDDPRNSNLTYLARPLPYDEGGNGSGTVTILDDDTTPMISVADTSANENAGIMPFWVSLSRASATDATVRYATADGTATAGSDYTAADGILTIEAGATGVPVPVDIFDDGDDSESDETFTLTLSDANGADISTTAAAATATIIEDSDLPTITMEDRSRSESRILYSRHLYFGARLSERTTRHAYVDWAVVEVPSLGDEAATIGSDFFPTTVSNTLTSPTSGVLRFYQGSDFANITFEIVADVIPERDERFQIILSNPRGALLEDSVVWGTIENDDLPIVTVADAQASEADDAVVFNLQLHAPGLDPASLGYTTVVRTSEGDRAASPGDDYTTASGTLNIPAGATTATIAVPIIVDTVDEEDETFLLVLASPENLEFRDRVAVGTITDDDDGYWIRDRSVWENAGSMDFTVQRDHTSTGPVTVNYRIGTGGSAVGGTACTDDGADYVTPSGTVTMPAAATTAIISIEICDDDDAEGRENLLVELTGVTGRQTTGVGTIVDNERTDLPRINIGDSASRTETLHDIIGAQFQITADRILRGDVAVTWRTEDCLATDTLCPNPATAGTDYTAASGTVTLTPTNPSATVTVAVADDTTDEDNEQFFVRITGVTDPAVIGSGATHADPVGIGRITDDDGQPTLYVRDSCAVEGDVARIPVVLSHAHTSHIFAQLVVTGGTAIRSDDIGRIGVLNLAERDTTAYIEIEVIQDNVTEGTETLELELNASPGDLIGIELGDTTATLTIREDSCN